MKRAGLFGVIALIIFFLVVGAHSKAEEQQKQREREQIQMIGKELDRVSRRANHLAEQIKRAAAIVEQSHQAAQ